MLTYGDGLADVNINELINFSLSHNQMITISGVRPPSAFGEFTEKNNFITSFTEKPINAKSYINGGFMVFDNELLGHLKDDEKDFDFEFEVFRKPCKKR